MTTDNTPTFDWLASLNGSTYRIQIDDNGNFSSPEQDVTVGVDLLSYVADELPDGRYFWRVRAINTDGAPTVEPTPEPIIEPTGEPAQPPEPTVEPTIQPILIPTVELPGLPDSP